MFTMQAAQKGAIGITLPSHWIMPLSDTESDRGAVLRSLDSMFGW